MITACASGIAVPPVVTVSVRVPLAHALATLTDPIAGEKATVGESDIDQPSLAGNCNVIWPPEGT
jgi:hypothetical protein